MVSRVFKFVFFIILASLITGCGASKKSLLTLVHNKKKTQMEWTKLCGNIPDHILPGEGAGVCWTAYERLSRKSGKSVLFVGVRMHEKLSKQVVVFGVPKGVNYEKGMRLKFDDEIPMRLQYTHCNNKGCYAQLPLTKNMLVKLKYSKRLVVAVMARYSEKAYGTNVPLYRFVYAYKSKGRGAEQVKTASR